MRRKLAVLLACLLLACLLLASGCAAKRDDPPTPEPELARRTYALVVKNLENPYMKTMYSGFEEACAEFGADAVLLGPNAGGAPSQSDALDALIGRRVDAIAIAANDRDEVSSALQRANAAGIPAVSLDSTVKPSDRVVHIQQASLEIIGRVLIQACAQMIGGEGEFAILTTTDTMPNQASWVGWMRRELDEHPTLYTDMQLVEIAYGLDEPAPSAAETERLLDAYPGLKAIIAPTVVGMRAAAEVIDRRGADVKLTGLALPSDMERYIMNGICPWMYLWNPAEVGYLAAYAMDAVVGGRLTGALDEIVWAGSLGDKIVTRGEDGGSEIVLGNPKVFDMTNIAVWGELF